MNVYEALVNDIAASEGAGMTSILESAYRAGTPREEALAALLRLYEDASQKGNEKLEDATVDLMDRLKWYCQPKYYIWPFDPNA